MFLFQRVYKAIVFILIISLLSCSAPLRSYGRTENLIVTAEQARKYARDKNEAVLFRHDGSEVKGHLVGWTEHGFLLQKGESIDTVDYNLIENYMKVNSYNRWVELCGGTLALGASAAIISVIKSVDDSETREGLGILSVFILAPAGIYFIFSGIVSGKYEKYYYDRYEFAREPYMFHD